LISGKLKIVWSVKSECGPIRKKNEDSVFPDLSGSGFVPFKAGVFDGMGGHKKGEVASKLASSVMKEDYENLISYVEKANKVIYEYQENNKDSEGMGTTMTAIKIDESGVLHVAHVGDSRCYVLSKRNLIKLTEDENVPGYQNVLLQALGTKKKLSIQTKDIKLFKGDVVLLCTDGLYNELGEEYLKKKLQEGISADTLVSEVLLQEPKDNITAIIINII
jgi:serine/threonine protein phosphatase PrpC